MERIKVEEKERKKGALASQDNRSRLEKPGKNFLTRTSSWTQSWENFQLSWQAS